MQKKDKWSKWKEMSTVNKVVLVARIVLSIVIREFLKMNSKMKEMSI